MSQQLQDKLQALYFFNYVRNSGRTIFDVMGDIEVYGEDNTIDIGDTRAARKEIYELYRAGEKLASEGWRLKYASRRMVGAAETTREPKSAVAWADVPAGHIATVPAVRRVWLLPPRTKK